MSEHNKTLNNLEVPHLSQKLQREDMWVTLSYVLSWGFFNCTKNWHTDKFKGLLKVLAQVLLVAVRDREALVDEEARVIVVQRQVGGHIQDVADVKALQHVDVLSVVLIPQVQEGQDGSQLCVLYVRGGGEGVR